MAPHEDVLGGGGLQLRLDPRPLVRRGRATAMGKLVEIVGVLLGGLAASSTYR